MSGARRSSGFLQKSSGLMVDSFTALEAFWEISKDLHLVVLTVGYEDVFSERNKAPDVVW